MIRQHHAIHDGAGRLDFRLGNAAVGLGDMAHDLEGGPEEGHLQPLGILGAESGPVQPEILEAALVQLMAQRGTQRGADGPSHHEAECAADDLADPAHETGVLFRVAMTA